MTESQEQILKKFQRLPNQSQWYFAGHFPIVCGVQGHADPEPTAMRNLCEAGLVVEGKCGLTNRTHYLLTDAGRALHEMLYVPNHQKMI